MAVWENQNLYERFVQTRQTAMEKDRGEFDAMREGVVEFLRPDLTVNTGTDAGKQMGTEIVESTGHFHAKTMAKWFIGNMVGPTLDWLTHKIGGYKNRGVDSINEWLQRTSDFFLNDVYAYPRSNFYEINNFFVLDGITVGSPVMLTEEDSTNNRKICTLPHFSENYLIRDYFGNDIAYHRKWELTNLAAMQAFGESLPAAIQSELERGAYHTKHKYLMCIARAGDPIFEYKNPKPENTVPKLWPWMQLWFCFDSVGETEKKPLNYQLNVKGNMLVPTQAAGYHYKPFHAWHYARLPHETYSRTPGWESLPDVKGLNAAWTSVHEAAHSYASPATIALETLKGKLKLGAKGVTWVDEQQYDRPPKPYETGTRYTWAMDFIERRSATVGRHFFSDIARMIENYSREHKQPPTAFQISQMISEAMVLIGPAITSYAGPYLHGIHDQFLEMELKSGRLERETGPPDEVFQTDGNLQPVFVGPLLQQLRYSMLSKRIQAPLMMAAPIFEIWPNSRDKIKAADLIEILLESSDFPQKAITTQEEYEQIQEAKAAEQRQIAALEKMKMQSEIVKDMQGETAEGSPLAKIGEAA